MISSIAAQQAKYKQFLVDWLVGFALLFMMHYIMSGIVSLNTIVVKLLSNGEGDSYYVGIAEMEDDVNAWDPDTDSTWFDIMVGAANDWFDKEKHENFKKNRLIVRNSSDETETFSNSGSSIAGNGKIDLNAVPKGKQDGSFSTPDTGYLTYLNGGPANVNHWGDNGVIYLSASIINPGTNNEKFENKAIARLNTMSFLRTVSSYALNDNEAIKLYDKSGKYDVDMAATFGYSILYLVLVVETIMFSITYIKRVLQMSFLTMVAPIVAIMYPVDKVGDGKAQAFNTWFKDYLFNILIQPMHLLLYTIFIVAASELSSRNIIYAVAMYGFMIPSEKYFKKILGFEKGGSNAGGGPMSNAIGRSLAMDGLGKLTGLGPAGRHGGGGKSGGGSSRKPKIDKNDPNNPSGLNPLGGGDSDMGDGSTQPRSRSRRQSNNSNQNNNNRSRSLNPMARPGDKMGWLRAGVNAGKRRIARAATGGRFSSMKTPGAWVAAATNAGKHVARGATRVVGTAGIGAFGLMAGTATAMTTGDINNVWRGAAAGVAAGNKLSSNTFDRGADALSAFSDEVSAERAANDYEYNKTYQQRQAFELLDEDLAECNENDRKTHNRTIEKYADAANIDSIETVEALEAIENEYNNDHPGYFAPGSPNENDQGIGVKALKYAKRYKEAYKNKDKIKEAIINDNGGSGSYTDAQAEEMWKLMVAAQKKLK
ncbi:MAG: hypothetical protein J6B87_04040 [Clostridia bacterium]|nr:hypothetical protein [Clostridia bacterium]